MPFGHHQRRRHCAVDSAAHRDGPLPHARSSCYRNLSLDDTARPCKPRIPRRLCSEVPAPTPYDSSPRAPRTPAREPRLLLHPSSSLRRVVLETPPPRAQPPAHLRLKSLLTRRIVDASGDAVWKVLLRDEPSGMIVGILVVLPVAELPNRLRVAGIAQVHGDRTRLALVDITHRSADRPD